MGRALGPVCRLCRRERRKLYLKGARCDTPKCAIDRRDQVPGVHAFRRGRITDYGLKLREKQKVKRFYGLLEKQFKIYFRKAKKQKGNTGENLLRMLERRFDSIVYRLGMAQSRAQSRQLINHGHFRVNGRRLDICSAWLKPGDVVTIADRKKSQNIVKLMSESVQGREIPSWLSFDPGQCQGEVKALPNREEVALPIEEQMIVELMSR